MNAKEMFESLGYYEGEKVKYYDKIYRLDCDYDDENYCTIKFINRDRVQITEWENGLKDEIYIDIQLLGAIVKQFKEMGVWRDNV